MLLVSLAELFLWRTISLNTGSHPQVDKLEQFFWDLLQSVLLEGQHSRGSSRLHLLSRHCPVFRVGCVLSIQEASNHNNKQAGRSSVTTFGHSLPVGTSEKRRGRGGEGGSLSIAAKRLRGLYL